MSVLMNFSLSSNTSGYQQNDLIKHPNQTPSIPRGGGRVSNCMLETLSKWCPGMMCLLPLWTRTSLC